MTEDGDATIPGPAHLNTQRAKGGRTEATRHPPLSAPPAFASTSSNAIVGDNSRSQMKRKESESLFTSKKRVRYFPAAHSDRDDVIDLVDLDEDAKYKRPTGINNSKSAPGIFLVCFLSHILICLFREENGIRWLATWSLSVCFFDDNE